MSSPRSEVLNPCEYNPDSGAGELANDSGKMNNSALKRPSKSEGAILSQAVNMDERYRIIKRKHRCLLLLPHANERNQNVCFK